MKELLMRDFDYIKTPEKLLIPDNCSNDCNGSFDL